MHNWPHPDSFYYIYTTPLFSHITYIWFLFKYITTEVLTNILSCQKNFKLFFYNIWNFRCQIGFGSVIFKHCQFIFLQKINKKNIKSSKADTKKVQKKVHRKFNKKGRQKFDKKVDKKFFKKVDKNVVKNEHILKFIWPKFRFLTIIDFRAKIYIFDQIFDFDQNLYFSQKFRFLI